jgi:hypothetical protein
VGRGLVRRGRKERKKERKTYKLPSRNMKQIAIFCGLPICSFSTLETGTARMQMSPKRFMMPTPR